MSTGDNPQDAKDAAEAMFNAIPKRRQPEYLGDLNEVLVYIDRTAPVVLHGDAPAKPK